MEVKKWALFGAILLDVLAAGGLGIYLGQRAESTASLSRLIETIAPSIQSSGIQNCGVALDALRSQIGLDATDERVTLSVIVLIALSLTFKIALLFSVRTR